MKRMIQGFVVAGALAVSGGALAADKAGTADVKGFVVPADAKGLLERLHAANQDEIKQGQLAQQVSQNPDVKTFAEQMVRQHTDADQKVQALAQTKKLKLADMPKPLDDAEKKCMAADKATMDKLKALKGEAFDGAYLAAQLGAHDAVLGKLAAGKQAAMGDAELSALVDELSQSVAQHRQHVYALLGKLSPQGAGAAMAPTMGGTTGAPAAPAPAPAQPKK
ncbi:DUF4142 domain-containing protein [Melittangium boletus]|uniref:DUF4142 domain-containing protein n=1 Tax=Melittangium boletus TaxID=83453 RepID=UPI003DA2A2A2